MGSNDSRLVRDHRNLRVFGSARDAAMRIYELSEEFPIEERYSLTAQIRRSSRSVCANIAEGWQKRRYPASFVAKLVDAAGEADETRVWIDFARRCGFLEPQDAAVLETSYDGVLASLVAMQRRPRDWHVR